MIILGIDPGSNLCGYGLIDFAKPNKNSYIKSAVINLKGDLVSKLHFLYVQMQTIAQQYPIDAVVCEKAFVHLNPHSTMKLSESRGVAIVAATQGIKDFFEYSPNLIKKTIVGNGHATKKQIQFMVKQILNISENISEDASDALACALCHAFHLNLLSLKEKITKNI